MAVKKQSKETIEEKINKDEQKCTCCGKVSILKNFYKSNSILFRQNKEQRMTICKDCIITIYDYYHDKVNVDINATYLTCQQLDMCFDLKLFEGVVKECEGTKKQVFQTYITKHNSLSQYKGKNFMDSDNFNMESVISEKEVDKQYQMILEKEFKITPMMIAFWGRSKSKEDMMFLENEYEKLFSFYQCESCTQEILFQEIAQTRLDIRKKRDAGINVDKEMKTLQDLLGSANIKPNQKNDLAGTNGATTIGEFGLEWEKTKPIPKPEDEFKDKDNIMKYFSVWFLGHICKIKGLNNDFTKMYDEEIEKYKVKRNEPNIEGDIDE